VFVVLQLQLRMRNQRSVLPDELYRIKQNIYLSLYKWMDEQTEFFIGNTCVS